MKQYSEPKRTVTLCSNGQDLYNDAYENYELELQAWMARMKKSLPFVVGGLYHRRDGVIVECIEVKEPHGGAAVALFSDYWTQGETILGWRYNRDADRGRCTGSRFDLFMTVIPKFPPEVIQSEPHEIGSWFQKAKKLFGS